MKDDRNIGKTVNCLTTNNENVSVFAVMYIYTIGCVYICISACVHYATSVNSRDTIIFPSLSVILEKQV